MRPSHQYIAAGLLGALAALGSASVFAQKNSDGGDYRPLTLNSPDKPEVQRGAIEAATNHNGAGSEGTGSSTAPKPTSDSTSSDEIQRGATAAARNHNGAGSEATGGSTAAPMPTSSGS